MSLCVAFHLAPRYEKLPSTRDNLMQLQHIMVKLYLCIPLLTFGGSFLLYSLDQTFFLLDIIVYVG